MVTTPFVLEAIRKVDIAGISLSAVYDSLKSFTGYEHVDLNINHSDTKRKSCGNNL